MKNLDLTNEEKYRIVEMAWQDRTTFDVIKTQFDLSENQIKNLMREFISPKAYKRWRKRVQGRVTKHKKRVEFKPIRFQGPW
ncbi:TIGR03643 family protein [Halarcobacter sp.]|uniref:TIGR03643 family protein n=1 Tax=Halarcobacter sp. TaxID=2321133 RepID=UPI002AAABD5F|nr:TIGR03643 family protein [Halarcobacter sp.]